MSLKGAKIYRIINNRGDIYYGSTCKTLKERLRIHKDAYKRWFYRYGSYCYSFIVMSAKRFKIQLVERCYNVKDKYELKLRERFYIENYPCKNHNVPGRSAKESYTVYNNKEERKNNLKQYYQDNKEHIRKQQKEYREKKVKSSSK